MAAKGNQVEDDLEPPDGGSTDGNLPGFRYSQQVLNAFGNALTSMGEAYNSSWNEIRQGNFGLGSWMKTMALTYESWFDAGVEVLKGPTSQSRPAWLHFHYNKNPGLPDTLDGSVTLDRKWSRDIELNRSPFERMGEGKGGGADIWKEVRWGDDLRRNSIRVFLEPAAVRKLPAGHYIGFILASGVTAEPPLAIVMLQVT